jgi:hypothetical protein
MKRLITLSFLCSLMFLVVNTAYTQKLSEKQRIKIENELETAFEEALKNGENLDVDKITLSVDDEYKAGHIVNGAYYNSFESLMLIFKSGIQNMDRQEFNIEEKKITVLAKDIAIISAAGKAKIYLNSGESFNAGFAWTFVYKNTNNVWKVIHSHRSSPR